MEKENFKTVANLVKDSLSLDVIIHLIMDNATLNYNGESLRITNEETVFQYIKYLYPNGYKAKLQELKELKIKE